MANTANMEWTGEWVAKRLEKHDEIQAVEVVAPQVLRIARKNHKPFVAATIAVARVEPSSFEELLDNPHAVHFVVNVPKESFWTGAAIERASRRSVGWGGLGDLFSAIVLAEPRLYVSKEFDFVERGLIQHSNVSGLNRVHDRKYVIRRYELKDLTVVLLNEYELTADHVRTARERYGPFNAILITNPNGRPTSSATSAAGSMGAAIYKWRELLGRLRKQ